MSPDNFSTLQKLGFQAGSAPGHVIVVTGAGRGIGYEIARAFAWLGYQVVIAELSDEGRETERTIREAGGEATFLRTDISDPAQVAALAERTKAAYGVVDILVNNAIYCPVGSVLEMDVSTWDRVMAVNLRGAFLTCKHFLPGMLDRKRGVIINMVSTDAVTHLSAYIASKQGLVGFSQSLAAEVGESGVDVIAFAPGFVATPGLRDAAEGLAPHLGMSAEQFLDMPIHPAYAGAMPAGDAAAATVCLALRLAGEYRGEVTNGYAILEQAGFLSDTPHAMETASLSQSISQKPASFESAIASSEQLQAVLAQTEAEIEKMPIFVRPMVRSGFKGKAGQNLPDWKRSAAALMGQLQQAQAGDLAAEEAVHKDLPSWISRLDRLESYYLGVPGETKRFTKDTEFLRQVDALTEERVRVVRDLKTILVGI